MIICFAKGRPIRMIICKMPVHPDDHMQKAGPTRRSFAKGRPILMINCKAPVVPYDHLQNPAHPDGHLEEATMTSEDL